MKYITYVPHCKNYIKDAQNTFSNQYFMPNGQCSVAPDFTYVIVHATTEGVHCSTWLGIIITITYFILPH